MQKGFYLFLCSIAFRTLFNFIDTLYEKAVSVKSLYSVRQQFFVSFHKFVCR